MCGKPLNGRIGQREGAAGGVSRQRGAGAPPEPGGGYGPEIAQ